MELFDLIDETDTVIGVTNKQIAHATGQLHRSSAVFVFNNHSELFVQIHKNSGGLYDHSVGGHVSQGETYAQAARREAQEELGLHQPFKQLSLIRSHEGPLMQHMFAIFMCTASPDWHFVPNDEVEEIIPMTMPQIIQLMKTSPEKFRQGFINTMQEFQRIHASKPALIA